MQGFEQEAGKLLIMLVEQYIENAPAEKNAEFPNEIVDSTI
jgi:hypothetical protein